MKQGARKIVLAIAILVVCAGGIGACWLWYPSDSAVYAIAVAVVALLLLMKQAAKWHLFQETPRFPISAPLVKAKWNFRAITLGLVCLCLAPFGAAYAIALGVRFHLVTSFATALVALSPFAALAVLGLFCVAKGIFYRSA